MLCINNSIFTGIPGLLKYLFFSFVLVKFPGRSIGPWSNEKAICCHLNNIKVLKSNRSVLRSVKNNVLKSKFVSVHVCLPPFPRFLSYFIYKNFYRSYIIKTILHLYFYWHYVYQYLARYWIYKRSESIDDQIGTITVTSVTHVMWLLNTYIKRRSH